MARQNSSKCSNLTATQLLAIQNGQIDKRGIIEVLNKLCSSYNAENYVLACIGMYNPETPKHIQCVDEKGIVYSIIEYDKFDEQVLAKSIEDNKETRQWISIEKWNKMVPVKDDEPSIKVADATFEEWLRDKAAIVNNGWKKKDNELAFFITTMPSTGQDCPNVGCHKMTVAGTIYFESITKAKAIAEEAKKLGYIK